MRYKANWLLECLTLRIKSSKVYDHLFRSGILPLPHPNTLRSLLGGMSSEFGFNKQALEAIKKILRGKSQAQRLGILCFDELSIKEDLTFNTSTFQFEGFVNLGSSIDEATRKLANHGLVFMFRPLLDSWVQPIAVFASCNAASGEDLNRLLLKAIVLLETYGARVLSVVCDGAQSNKSLWKTLGVSVKNDGIVNQIPHPTVPDAKIYFVLDPPHAFKCVRNQIYNLNLVQAGGMCLSFEDIKLLFHADERMGHLKVCPRLTYTHVYPTNFQKMSVKLAVQVMSDSVADGFCFYRDTMKNEAFQHTQNIEDLFRLLNKSFDILNARHRFAPAMTLDNWEGNKEVLCNCIFYCFNDRILYFTPDYLTDSLAP